MSIDSNGDLAALEARRGERDYAAMRDFSEAIAMLDIGECLVEYRRANGRVKAVVVQVPGSHSQSETEPFAVRYNRSAAKRVVYSATCNVPAASWDAALNRVSWSPGKGPMAAGKGWGRGGPPKRGRASGASSNSSIAGIEINRERGSLQGIMSASITIDDLAEQYSSCWIMWNEFGEIVEYWDCVPRLGDSGQCEDGFILDASTGNCEDGSTSGNGETDPPPEPLCDPALDPDCEQALTPTDELVLDAAMQLRNGSILDSTIRAECDKIYNDFAGMRAQGRVFRGGSNTTQPDSAHSGAYSQLSQNIHFDPIVLDSGESLDLRWLGDILSAGMHEAAHMRGHEHGPKQAPKAPFTYPIEYNEAPFSYLGRKMAESCISW